FFQAEDGIRDFHVTGVQTCALPILRKKGIKIAFPIKSIRFIRADECGINRFNASPAIKAPIIGSKPQTSAIKAAKKTMERTKIRSEERRVGKECKTKR